MRLKVRPAQPADVRLFFDWANDPITRQQSFSTEPISWEDHSTWFSRKLADPNALLLVFEMLYKPPIGQMRFERTPEEVIVSLSLDKAYRGKGMAPDVIRLGLETYRAYFQRDSLPIRAYIRPENLASVRSFERAGFTLSHESSKFGVSGVVYTANS